MDVDYQWPEKHRNTVERVVKALEGFNPAGLALYVDEGLPWVLVHYDRQVAQPGQVVPIGEAISDALRKPVLFQALRPNSIYYIVEDLSVRKDNDPNISADKYGVPLNDLREAWEAGSLSSSDS